MSFRAQYEHGKVAESAIARWLMSRGNAVMPVYEILDQQYKGPQLFTLKGGIIAPDMLAFCGTEMLWVEAKHKTGFTWWRKGGVFETGIDLHHFAEYQRVASVTGRPVWVLFLHKGGQAKDSPPSPSGLFGNEVKVLAANESHRDPRWGKHGMVYWTRQQPDGGALRFLAAYSDVLAADVPREHGG